jgi:hypothetical protein
LKANGSGTIETVERSEALYLSLSCTKVERRIRIDSQDSTDSKCIVPPSCYCCCSWPADVVHNVLHAGGCSPMVFVEDCTNYSTIPTTRSMGKAQMEPQAHYLKAIQSKIKRNPVGFALKLF